MLRFESDAHATKNEQLPSGIFEPALEHVTNEQTDAELGQDLKAQIEHHLILTYYRGFIKKSFFFQQNEKNL